MQEELRKKILTANIDLHRLEARYYDIIHCENLNSHEQRRLRASLRACIASLDRSARCLDVGAGTGNITSKLVEMGFENITCVDISAEMLEVLRRNVASPTLRIVCSDIDSFLEGDDDTYRLVTMGGVVHHLPDPQRSLRRIFERIDREGVLFITQEPTKGHNRRGAFARVLAEGVKKVEYGCYVARYLIYIVLGKLKYLVRGLHLLGLPHRPEGPLPRDGTSLGPRSRLYYSLL